MRETFRARTRVERHPRGWLAISGALLLLFLSGPRGRAAAAETSPALRVIESYELPGEPSTATDVRWAGDRSVYLARQHDGVSELRLESGLPRVRRVVPDRETLGLRTYRAFSRLAASAGYLAWGQGVGLVAWRPLTPGPDRSVTFEWKPMAYAEDVDLAGDRLLVLGTMYEDPAEYRNFSPDGAVAYLGSAREKSDQTFRPVLFDPAGKGAPHLLHCGGMGLGAVRFLRDGAFFVLPGFQAGAHLFSADGALVRTWNTTLLGLDADADCATMSMEEAVKLHQQPELRMHWLNRHRVVDDVLSLPSGPGVVVRSFAAGKIRWELDVLGAGGISTYEIPLPARSPRERLRGDYRSGRIVFLVTEEKLHLHAEKAASRLVVLELPQS